MLVAIDATPLLGIRSGVATMVDRLLAQLATADDLDVLGWALTWRRRGRLGTEVPTGVAVGGRAMPARPLRAVWRRLDHPRLESFIGPADVVHGTNFVLPPSRAPGLVTVHDLTCVRFPELCTPDTLAYPQLLRRAIARGATIHAVSDFVATECVELLGADPDRVVAIPNGFGATRTSGDGTSGARDGGGSDRNLAHRLAGGGHFLLGLSTVEPRKDFPSLVAAFDELGARHPELRLVIAGADGWGADALTASIRRSPYRSRIRRLGWVDDDERAALLRHAAVFVYPSVYEGFGLPPLEAMAAGTPVVTSDAGALPEVTADAARRVPVGDHLALAEAIGALLEDPASARRLVEAGRRRAQQFRWEDTARALADLYRRLASEPRRR